MAGLATLTEPRLMFTFGNPGVVRRVYAYPIPLLDTVCYPFRVALLI